jgi:hypothetical protein
VRTAVGNGHEAGEIWDERGVLDETRRFWARTLRCRREIDRVYWSNQLKLMGSVASVPKAGGVVTTLASGQIEPLDVVVDNTSVYWGTADGCVMKAAKP